MEKDKQVLVELILDNDEGLEIISFVENPAIESTFQYFSEDKIKLRISNEDKRVVVGPALIPNKEILRLDGENKPYWIFFSEETIIKAQEYFFKKGKTDKTNYNHESVDIDGVNIIESWIVEEPNNDKSNHLGFDVPKGTWMVSYKVDDDDLWNKVKTGEVQGFSIEGMFSKKIVKMSDEINYEDTYEDIKTIINDEGISEDDFFDKVNEIIGKLK